MATNNTQTFNAEQILTEERNRRDAIARIAAESGLSVAEVNTLVKKEAYRRQYNARPEVKEKRAERQKLQAAKMKAFRAAMKAAEEGAVVKAIINEMATEE